MNARGRLDAFAAGMEYLPTLNGNGRFDAVWTRAWQVSFPWWALARPDVERARTVTWWSARWWQLLWGQCCA